MKFKKLTENGKLRCWAEIEGEEIELNWFYSHEKPVAIIKDICTDRQYLSLSKITVEGEWQEIELKAHESHSQIKLTKEEAARIAELEAEIKAIKEAAKARKPLKFEQMNKEQQIEYLKAQLAKLEA